jgi:hypothetical protein
MHHSLARAASSTVLLLFSVLALLPFSALGVATSLLGAGSSFPEPVMLAQAAAFKLSVPFLQQYAGSNVTYPKGTDGSAFAIPLLAAKSIHFIGTDIALTAAQLATLRAANGNAAVLHIPQVLTGVVTAYHLPGWSTTLPPQPPLNFTADLLARIFLCQVRWGVYLLSDLGPGNCGLHIFLHLAMPSRDLLLCISSSLYFAIPIQNESGALLERRDAACAQPAACGDRGSTQRRSDAGNCADRPLRPIEHDV